ncbi:acetate/propionate family kinase [Methylocaldum szegediense]|uniref:acetate/propionate family kinase n=1 Tax=Methylocaldum szegediense TaxID=73780 RepID=UPI0003F87939|nr:acetate kinase [Methylocaldum szegediense]
MHRKVLVLNSGSSSVKYRLFDLDVERVLVSGVIERIGESSVGPPDGNGEESFADHRQAIAEVMRKLRESGELLDSNELYAIGHRVVHGGEIFRSSVIVDDAVIEAIRAAFPLAPLQNPPNLLGIEVCRELWPGVPQVAVFDTAFHLSMPPHAYRYALPDTFYRDHGIRRYGFHGTSFAYVAKRAAAYLGRPLESCNFIALHLGNGASAVAIKRGRSVDTSMGMTPLAGLIMGTRCGDIDPGVLLYLINSGICSTADLDWLLSRNSGLKGLVGANDMREILRLAAAGDGDACLAVEMYCYAIKKYIGGYLAILGNIDALIFTAGIGEHAAPIRYKVCSGLEPCGIAIDIRKNAVDPNETAELQAVHSRTKILIVPTDEELEIAREAAAVMDARVAGFNG